MLKESVQQAANRADFDCQSSKRYSRYRLCAALIPLILVCGVHAGAVAFALWTPATEIEDIELPTIQGVLIPAPPAESVQLPSSKKAPPVEQRPEPKQKPAEHEPKQKQKSVPKHTALKESEKIEVIEEIEEKKNEINEINELEQEEKEEQEQEQDSEPTVAVNSSAVDKERDTMGAPVTPPQQNADHLNNPAPAYPSISRRLREQGIVVLEVLILPDGSVGDIRIKKSSGYERLDNTAMKAIRSWKYVPAKRGDQPIAYWYKQPLEFSLN